MYNTPALVDKQNNMCFFPLIISCKLNTFYPRANEVAKGYSNATILLSFHNILVNTLESTSFNGF